MHTIKKEKLFEPIYSFLNESMDEKQAKIQAEIFIENINETLSDICLLIEKQNFDKKLLSKKFHTLKNLLLYGDFYFESDICQDIESLLRNDIIEITKVKDSFSKLISCLT